MGAEAPSRRWWALAAVSLSVLAVGLDGTVLTVALPTLAGKLHASESDLQWFTSAYLRGLAAAMRPAGMLGDRYGRKKVLVVSLVLFALGSALCATATSSAEFLAARALLGFAGAGVIVMAVTALTVLFDERERPRAVGIWAAMNFLALPIGPILGGWLLTHYWWGWIFLMNVPVVLIALIAVTTLVPESRASQRPAFDLPGVGLSVAGLTLLTYGFIRAGQDGWGTLLALLSIGVGVALLLAFLAWEQRLTRRADGEPLVDLALFRSASFTWGVILAAIGVLAMLGVMFTMPQYFQGVAGTSAMGSGLRLLPLIGGLIVGALPADQLVRRIGAKLGASLGFALIGTGLGLGTATGVHSSGAFLACWMALVGAGMGLALATASSAALAELSPERSGVGSAVLQAVNKTGGPLGAAILGSVLSSIYLARLSVAGLPAGAGASARASIFGAVALAHKLGDPALLQSARGAFVHGMDGALIVSCGFAALGLLLALAWLPARAHTQITEQVEVAITS